MAYHELNKDDYDRLFQRQLEFLDLARSQKTHERSSLVFLDGLRFLLTRVPRTNLSWAPAVLHAALLNAGLKGSQIFVEEFLGNFALLFLKRTVCTFINLIWISRLRE